MFIATVDETLALMEKSAAEKDADESRRLSHTLKGVAANMGADRMYAIIAEIETLHEWEIGSIRNWNRNSADGV